MEALIRSRHVPLSPALRQHCVRRLEFALRRFRPHLASVSLTLQDVNGPRGGRDQHSRVLVDLVMTLLSVGFMWLGVAHFAAEQFAQIAPRRYWPELSRIVIGIGQRDGVTDAWRAEVLDAGDRPLAAVEVTRVEKRITRGRVKLSRAVLLKNTRVRMTRPP